MLCGRDIDIDFTFISFYSNISTVATVAMRECPVARVLQTLN